MEKKKTEKTKLDLPANTSAALSYVLGPITGIIFYLLEDNQYVRFHASQSIAVLGFFWILSFIIPFTLILAPLVPVLSLVSIILWIVLIVRAYKGEKWEVPLLGQFRTIVESALGGDR